MTTLEVCILRMTELKDLGSLNRVGFVLQYEAFQGSKLIAKSDKFRYEVPVFGNKEKAKQESVARRENAYQQVLTTLFQDGWEPMGTDSQGRVMSFKRIQQGG